MGKTVHQKNCNLPNTGGDPFRAHTNIPATLTLDLSGTSIMLHVLEPGNRYFWTFVVMYPT